ILGADQVPVSPRTCCWVDVLEACASVFDMKSDSGFGVVPLKLSQPSLDNVDKGLGYKALMVLLGGKPGCKDIIDAKAPVNPNWAFGVMNSLLDQGVFPDLDSVEYRRETIKKFFGSLEQEWHTWANTNPTAWKNFIVQNTRGAAMVPLTDPIQR